MGAPVTPRKTWGAPWPQHLHNYLTGAARSLIEAGGDLARAELGAALAHGDRAKVYSPRSLSRRAAATPRMLAPSG